MGLDWEFACRRLGLAPEVDLDEIKRRFRDLAKKHHPDAFLTPLDRLKATKRFQPIAEAYNFLLRATEREVSNGQASDREETTSERVGVESPDLTTASSWEDVNMFTILEPLRARSPQLAMVLEWILLPCLIPMFVWQAFTGVALIALMPLLAIAPESLSNFATHTALRWAPMAINLYLGLAEPWRGTIVGNVLLFCGAFPALLELAGQVLAFRSLSSACRALDMVLMEVRSREGVVQ